MIYTKATQNCAWLNLDTRSYFEIQGEDSKKFLNGLLTNDIQKLVPKTGCYALLLTAKGKIVADLFCYGCPNLRGTGGDYFGIDCEAALKQTLLENLKRYIIFQKVKLVEPESKWEAATVLGPQSEAVLKEILGDIPLANLSYAEKIWEEKPVWVICKMRWGLPAYEFWAKKETVAELKLKLGLAEVDSATSEILRLESATPKFGVDMDENTIPQEANLYNALNFNKGCYVGQEIVARLEHRGHVGKKLVQLQIHGDVSPANGDKISNGEGLEIGAVTSSCLSPKFGSALALGYIRYNFLKLTEVRIGASLAKIL